MRKWIAGVDRALQTRFPLAYYQLIQRPRLFFRFRTEKQLVRGVSLSKNEHASILFFTTHKCASRYVSRLFTSLAEAEGMTPVDYDAFVTSSKVPLSLHPYKAEGTLSFAFQPQGYYYGPIGSYREIPQHKDYRVFLQLRDPRDVLTSLYYSTSFSHALISPKVLRERKAALEISLDEFVLDNAKRYYLIYSDYCEYMLGQNTVLFLKYENMVGDFEGWLKQLSEHTGMDHLYESLQRIQEQADFQVSEENIFSQRRQVTPGDHMRKLKPETIVKLNDVFSPILTTLGYS